MNILMVGMEATPFAKVGGLADVMGSLPKALKSLGHDVRVMMPCFKMIEQNPAYAVEEIVPPFAMEVRPGSTQFAFVKQTFMPQDPAASEAGEGKIPVYLIGSPVPEKGSSIEGGFFQEATDSSSIYVYAPEPYVFFCHAVLEAIERIDPAWRPDVIHCNDWHTGLIPVYSELQSRSRFGGHTPATLFTIHNLAYQGNFDRSEFYKTGLPDRLFTVDGLEFYGQWTFMKGALVFADQVNTVSPTYAREIQTLQFGAGLEGLLREMSREGRLSGVLNGIDPVRFNPETDPDIPTHFSASDLSGKEACKSALQKELGLPQKKAPLISVISRLADQKGLDLVLEIAEQMLEMQVQFVLLGTGDPVLERGFSALQARYPKQVQVRIKFDAELAQRIYAGSDLFLMPSRFEPCGLGQLISLRYGTIPIVRATGGLADTVSDFDPVEHPEGNGFVFTEISSQALLEAVIRALTVYRTKKTWKQLVQRAMETEHNWDDAAERYVELYRRAATAHRTGIDPHARVA